MARPRIDFGPDAETRIRALTARGLGPVAVAAELGCSRATAKRRMRELKVTAPTRLEQLCAELCAVPPHDPRCRDIAVAICAEVRRLDVERALAVARGLVAGAGLGCQP